MGFFDTLTQTITGRNEFGRTPEEEAHLHRAKWLEFDFYSFAQVWIIPSGSIHASKITEQFKLGLQKKYNGEEMATDVEALQLLARWNERYGKAKWNDKGLYMGIQLNPAAVKAAEDAKKTEDDEREAARNAKRKHKKKKTVAAAPPKPLTATFRNTGGDPNMAKAELYYETTRWGNIGHGDPPISVGSFTGHRWVSTHCAVEFFLVAKSLTSVSLHAHPITRLLQFVRIGEQVVNEFVIGKDSVQEFTF